jgi:pentatricopeptide repeat protein
MSLLHTLQRSTNSRPIHANTVPLWTFFCPALYDRANDGKGRRQIHTSTNRLRPALDANQVDELFIRALCSATRCRRAYTTPRLLKRASKFRIRLFEKKDDTVVRKFWGNKDGNGDDVVRTHLSHPSESSEHSQAQPGTQEQPEPKETTRVRGLRGNGIKKSQTKDGNREKLPRKETKPTSNLRIRKHGVAPSEKIGRNRAQSEQEEQSKRKKTEPEDGVAQRSYTDPELYTRMPGFRIRSHRRPPCKEDLTPIQHEKQEQPESRETEQEGGAARYSYTNPKRSMPTSGPEIRKIRTSRGYLMPLTVRAQLSKGKSNELSQAQPGTQEQPERKTLWRGVAVDEEKIRNTDNAQDVPIEVRKEARKERNKPKQKRLWRRVGVDGGNTLGVPIELKIEEREEKLEHPNSEDELNDEANNSDTRSDQSGPIEADTHEPCEDHGVQDEQQVRHPSQDTENAQFVPIETITENPDRRAEQYNAQKRLALKKFVLGNAAQRITSEDAISEPISIISRSPAEIKPSVQIHQSLDEVKLSGQIHQALAEIEAQANLDAAQGLLAWDLDYFSSWETRSKSEAQDPIPHDDNAKIMDEVSTDMHEEGPILDSLLDTAIADETPGKIVPSDQIAIEKGKQDDDTLQTVPEDQMPMDTPVTVYSVLGKHEILVSRGTWAKVERLRLLLRVTDYSRIPRDQLFDAYIGLPEPRTPLLSGWEVNRLLTALSWVERPTEESMGRFLAVMDDLKAQGRKQPRQWWNTAVHMAAKLTTELTKTVRAESVESAMEEWREMEARAGIAADVVTFTIMFDAAAKAREFELADMLFREMVNRKIKIDGTARLARIFYHGLRGDGDAVRYGYAKFVDAGEIVTTQVLNCIITSLLNAGEVSSAEQVFQRMKEYHAERVGDVMPTDDWRESRKIRRIISNATQKWRDNPRAMRSLQDAVAVAPNLNTYRLLIRYHAAERGNIDRVMELLNEVRSSGLELSGKVPIMPNVFKGFVLHAGVRFTSWTLLKLEGVWKVFLQDVDNRPDEYTHSSCAAWSLLAFAKCASYERTLEAWGEIQARWKPDQRLNDLAHATLMEKWERAGTLGSVAVHKQHLFR